MTRRSIGLALLVACGRENAPAPASGGKPPPEPLAIAPLAPSATPERDCAEPYAAAPTSSGRKPSLPLPPELVDLPARIGDSFTVFGAVHALRSRFESEALALADVSIVGFIIDTNLPRAPRCAIHRKGVADPAGCDTELPLFAIADQKGATAAGGDSRIRVVGWAANFSSVYEAQLEYAKTSARPSKLYNDPLWGVDVPWPLPAVGAKVKVTGRYGALFTKSSRGILSDPKNGILTVTTVEYLEPAPKPATLGR